MLPSSLMQYSNHSFLFFKQFLFFEIGFLLCVPWNSYVIICRNFWAISQTVKKRQRLETQSIKYKYQAPFKDKSMFFISRESVTQRLARSKSPTLHKKWNELLCTDRIAQHITSFRRRSENDDLRPEMSDFWHLVYIPFYRTFGLYY